MNTSFARMNGIYTLRRDEFAITISSGRRHNFMFSKIAYAFCVQLHLTWGRQNVYMIALAKLQNGNLSSTTEIAAKILRNCASGRK